MEGRRIRPSQARAGASGRSACKAEGEALGRAMNCDVDVDSRHARVETVSVEDGSDQQVSGLQCARVQSWLGRDREDKRDDSVKATRNNILVE